MFRSAVLRSAEALQRPREQVLTYRIRGVPSPAEWGQASLNRMVKA